MRAVLQRASRARVLVAGAEVGSLEPSPGLVALVGVGPGDGAPEARLLADKIAGLRIFSDEQGKFNLSLRDVRGGALVISQFTLFADIRRGRRPGFTGAAPPEHAAPLVDCVMDELRALGVPVQGGRFGAHMEVELVNDGPVTIELDTDLWRSLMGTLYLVATPIGNLEDITLRALRVLREVRLIAAEDTRHTRKLLSHFDIPTPTTSYHEHSLPARRAEIVAALAEGDVAVVTDAGTPGISDPGHDLVVDAIAAGYPVVAIPGPVAAVAALVASGLPTDHFTFLGFLPRKPAERRAALERVRAVPATLVLYEAPHRLLSCLDDLLAVLGDRDCAVARELTKLHEEWLRGTLSSVRERSASGAGPRGEYTLVVAGAATTAAASDAEGAAVGDAHVNERLAALLAGGMRTRDAAALVASETGRPKREVYQLALTLRATGPLDLT